MTVQRNRFLTDMLSTLFDRSQRLRGKSDARDIEDLCRALISTEGVISGQALAATVFERYRSLSDADKLAFFKFLNDEMDVDAQSLARLATAYAKDATPDAFVALSRAAEPKRQELLRRLNQPMGATADIVAMRVDLLRILKSNPDLARTDHRASAAQLVQSRISGAQGHRLGHTCPHPRQDRRLRGGSPDQRSGRSAVASLPA